VVRLARENPSWGYRGVQASCSVFGVKLAASTVWAILKEAGIEPAPKRLEQNWSDLALHRRRGRTSADCEDGDAADEDKPPVPQESRHPFEYSGVDRRGPWCTVELSRPGTLFVTSQYRSSSSSVGRDSVGSASIALRCSSGSGLW